MKMEVPDYSRARFYRDIRTIYKAIGIKNPKLGWVGGLAYCCYLGEARLPGCRDAEITVMAGCPRQGILRYSIQVDLCYEYVDGDGKDTLAGILRVAPGVIRRAQKAVPGLRSEIEAVRDKAKIEACAALERLDGITFLESITERDEQTLLYRFPRLGDVKIVSQVERNFKDPSKRRPRHTVSVADLGSQRYRPFGVAHTRIGLVRILRELIRPARAKRGGR